MPKKYILGAAAVLFVIIFFAGIKLVNQNQLQIYTEEQSGKIIEARQVVENWITNYSPTYVFDGMNLSLNKITALDLNGCKDCFQFEYRFESRQAGYGDRTGKILAQVITPHIIIVTIESGRITRAVTDGIYDELEGRMIGE